jgi:hypothetical protein
MRETRPATRLDWASHDRIAPGQGLCGRDRIRTCVGNAGDFTGRSAVTSQVPSHPHLVPIMARDVHNGRSTASAVPRGPHPYRPVPRGPASVTISRRCRSMTFPAGKQLGACEEAMTLQDGSAGCQTARRQQGGASSERGAPPELVALAGRRPLADDHPCRPLSQ